MSRRTRWGYVTGDNTERRSRRKCEHRAETEDSEREHYGEGGGETGQATTGGGETM